MQSKSIIVGVGHPMRSDDGLGPKAIEQIKPLLSQTIDCISILGDLSDLLDVFENYQNVYIIDAIFTQNAPAGTLHRFEKEDIARNTKSIRTSTHSFDLCNVLELAQNLNTLPNKLIVFGIEATDFSPSNHLSIPVEQAMPKLIQLIRDELNISR